MTRKDFELIADMLHKLRFYNRHEVAGAFAREMSAQLGPRFKTEVFLKRARYCERYDAKLLVL